MNVSLNPRWQVFLDQTVTSGRFPSAEAVVEEGLRLLVERDGQLAALRAKIDAAIAEGGEFTDAEVAAALEAHAAEWSVRRA